MNMRALTHCSAWKNFHTDVHGRTHTQRCMEELTHRSAWKSSHTEVHRRALTQRCMEELTQRCIEELHTQRCMEELTHRCAWQNSHTNVHERTHAQLVCTWPHNHFLTAAMFLLSAPDVILSHFFKSHIALICSAQYPFGCFSLESLQGRHCPLLNTWTWLLTRCACPSTRSNAGQPQGSLRNIHFPSQMHWLHVSCRPLCSHPKEMKC